MNFYVIGDEDTVLGFRLAGIPGTVVRNPEETREALRKCFQMQDLGIVVLTERLAESIREDVDRYVYKTTFPLIIEIPDGQGPMKGRRSMRELIRSAVGIHI